MSNHLTIVMYHYVRDLQNSYFPEMKGLDISLFIEQIEYLEKHYNFITMEHLIAVLDGDAKMPMRPVLLTFDDGYIEHFNYVFPLLDRKKIQGSFFPPVKLFEENRLLEVNKIHYILASEKNKPAIIDSMHKEMDRLRETYSLENNVSYEKKYGSAKNRLDDIDVTYIKRMLQFALPREARSLIIDNLFRKFVTYDEQTLHQELYMTEEQILCMRRNGMHFGGHGYCHDWLNHLTPEEQEVEIDQTAMFLGRLGISQGTWTMNYPYGAFNEDTKKILKSRGFKLAVTTHPDIADFGRYDRFELPRLDTNDLPKDRNGRKNKWYRKVKE